MRAVFLDFDGTLADGGRVPDAHVEAVRAARKNNRVLLCTGRPKAMLKQVLPIGFDGIVASAGGYVEVNGEVLLDRRWSAPLAKRGIQVLDEHDVAYLLESPESVLGRPGVDERIIRRLDLSGIDPEKLVPGLDIQMTDDLSGASFAKVSCFDSDVPVDQLAAEMGTELAAVESSLPGEMKNSGEIYLKDVHKNDGAAIAAEALGVLQSDVIAVGDGINDLELLDYAGLGVAIEGADPRVLAVAQRLAPPPSEDGLATLFTELGLV